MKRVEPSGNLYNIPTGAYFSLKGDGTASSYQPSLRGETYWEGRDKMFLGFNF